MCSLDRVEKAAFGGAPVDVSSESGMLPQSNCYSLVTAGTVRREGADAEFRSFNIKREPA
jgi:hypothetical protein